MLFGLLYEELKVKSMVKDKLLTTTEKVVITKKLFYEIHLFDILLFNIL